MAKGCGMGSLAGAVVLLLEDEFLIAVDAERVLEELGAAEVKMTATLEEAEREAAGRDFDLALLDVNINGQISLPLAHRLHDRGVPVVLATGYDLHASEIPRDSACVSKPYSKEALNKAIATVLERRG